MTVLADDKELRYSILLLGSVLRRVLKTQALPEIFSTVKQLQQRFAEFNRDPTPAKLEVMRSAVQQIEPHAIGEVVRVFNHYFSLLNIAEESYYLGIRRKAAYGRQAILDHPV